MMYKTKPKPVTIVSFDEFVKYGLSVSKNTVNGMPWSFEYSGLSVTHETDSCYILSDYWTKMNFISGNFLVIDESGDAFLIDKETLEKEYELVEPK